jgi:ATP-dependent RNA helicase DHX8/PRP22
MSTDKELYKLELLSLVSRVSQELFNHTKLQDKNLAEFVIAVSFLDLGRSHRSYMNRARPRRFSNRI